MHRLGSAGLVYGCVFALLAWPSLMAADTSSAVGANAADEALVAWILGWVRYSLAHDPASLFHAPINFPAPLQLAGSEHLLSSQLLFAPLFALTGSNMLAANITAFLTYPLSAILMQRLLLALGCGSIAAFSAGFAFALGPFQVPMHLHVLQYTNLFLPLVALSLLRLRRDPNASRAMAFAAASLFALLGSYYIAVITAVGGALWGLQEFMRSGAGRIRFLLFGAAAATFAGTLFVWVSLPYFEMRELVGIAPPPDDSLPMQRGLSQLVYSGAVGFLRANLLLGCGCLVLLAGPATIRRGVLMGVVFLIVGPILAGSPAPLAGLVPGGVPSWWPAVQVPGLDFFRYPFRFALLTGFGAALVVGGGLESIRVRLGRPGATMCAVALVTFVAVERGSQMWSAQPLRFVDSPVGLVEMITETTREFGEGPLLELPRRPPLFDEEGLRGGTEVRAMLRSLEHGLPLVDGHSGYLPRHRRAVDRRASALLPRGLQRLVDATGIRWILARPETDWSARELRFLKPLLESSALRLRGSHEGWRLFEVRLKPFDDDWVEAIRDGASRLETAFGTPLEPLDPTRARGTILLRAPGSFTLGNKLVASLLVTNTGDVTWPAASDEIGKQHPSLVRLLAVWRDARDTHSPNEKSAPVLQEERYIDWDLRPGEQLAMYLRLDGPSMPGDFILEVMVAQGDTSADSLPGIRPVRRRLSVQPAPEAPVAAVSRPNILLISIDSLRPDHLGISGYARDTSPNIDQLARDGAVFSNAVSSSSWTLPAHATLLTALPPSHHRVIRPADALSPAVVSLAEVLQVEGYSTAGFVSGPFVRALHGFGQGFDVYDETASADGNLASHKGRTSPVLFERFRDWLTAQGEERDRPFFAFLHMWDVHYDFDPPPPYDSMFDPGYEGDISGENFELGAHIHAGMDPRDLEHVIALYDGEIRYTDEYVGKIVDLLREQGVYENTIIVLTSDHGEEFFEHGSKGHGKNLYDETIRVPMIFAAPNLIPPGQAIQEQVRLADIAPTILGLGGIPSPPAFGRTAGASRGVDLSRSLLRKAPMPAGLIAHSSLQRRASSARGQEGKVIHTRGRPVIEFYDLRVDPGELEDLGGMTPLPNPGDSLVQAGENHRLATWQLKSFRESAKVTREHADKLRALGYIE